MKPKLWIGPWKVDIEKEGKETKFYITGPSPAELGLCKMKHKHGDHDCSMAEDVAQVDPHTLSSKKQAMARARLIRAAPELVVALVRELERRMTPEGAAKFVARIICRRIR